jgi:hypothetical protein
MAFGALFKVQRLLTKHNVELLLAVVSMLADPKNPVFNGHWRQFMQERGGSLDDVTAGAALLEKLRDILREYLKEMR